MDWEIWFSSIDAKEYPVVIIAMDGVWEQYNYDEAMTDSEVERLESVGEAAENYYLSLVKEAQEKTREKFLPILQDQSLPIPETPRSDDFDNLYYT